MSLTGIQSIRLAIAIAAALAGGHAFAQTTASQILEEVTVTGDKVEGELIRKETAAKSRSTVGQEYFNTQSAGQTVFQSINLVPGVNFTNSDPYGSSGGNIRLRGFDGNRIAVLSDGIPLNDTGNYAVFTNQQLDSEIVERVNVNLGTTDVDSPTAAATGGTINLVTNIPDDDFGGMVKASFGDDSYHRYFVRADTGEFGPWKTKAFFTSSWQKYDKFRGPGDLDKRQINGRIYQDLGDGDFVSLAFHGNRNRNYFYRNITKAQIARSGFGFDQFDRCLRAPGIAVAGTVQNDNAVPQGDPDNSTSCTNYFGVRRNPSDTANIRGQSSFGLTDSLRLTFDPNFQYVLANGGGYQVIQETDRRLRGTTSAAGVDLNGDGDTLDNIGLYAPNNTNTRRYGLTTSLIWEIDDLSSLRLGYTLDYGKHRQTAQVQRLDANGNPDSDFAGRDGPSVASANGGPPLRIRDRLSVARLNQASLSYATQLFDQRLGLNVGLRAPFFRRELNQKCFTQLSGNTQGGNVGVGNPLCTTEVANAPGADGTVTFVGRGTASFLPQFGETVKFDELLPNVSFSYAPTRDTQVYVSYAKGFSAPRTDNLYTNAADLDSVNGEKTDTVELGYRYQTGRITASSAIWSTQVSDRIVSAFDQDLGINVDRNVGDVDMVGLDAAIGAEIFQGFSAYLTGSYIDTEIQDDFVSNGVLLPTKNKELVETPDFTLGARVEYRLGGFSAGLQAKYVDDRFATDLNDEVAPSYKVFDLDASYAFDMFGMRTSLQVNVSNLFDEEYLGNLVTTTTAKNAMFGIRAPQYSIGAPRTVQFTLESKF